MVAVGQFARPVEHCKIAIGIAMHSHTCLDVVAAVLIRRYLQVQFFEAHTVVGTGGTLVLLAQDVVETVSDPCREGWPLLWRGLGKLGVEGRQTTRCNYSLTRLK